MDALSNSLFGLSLVSVVVPLVISLLALYPIRMFAERLGLLDRPGGHSSHTIPTPLGGGLGIWLGIVGTFAGATIAALVLQSSTELQSNFPPGWMLHLDGAVSRLGSLWGLLGCGTFLVGLGLWDDRHGLSPWLRLLAQFATAAIVVYGLDFAFTAYIAVAWITKPLSVIWIVAVINSFNMLDNMDALSGGVATIIAASMAVVMMSTPDPGTASPQLLVAVLLWVVCGSLLGFLWHNRPPAKIFMGDGGSYLVGFLISVSMLMATYSGGQVPRPHAVLAPLCVMAVPLYDMTTVIWIRLRQGRSPFVGDKSHFSHRLVDLGLSRRQAVATVHLVTATCGLAAMLLTGVSVAQAWMVIGIVACMLLLVIILESTKW